MIFHKDKKYKIDPNTAGTALEHIFAACGQAPNTIPFDKLALRRKVDLQIYDRLLFITGLMLLITFLSPLAIVPAAGLMEHFSASKAAVTADYVKNDLLFLELTGDGILYQSAYLETKDGQKLPAVSYDAQNKLICFPYLENTEAEVYIPIEGKKALHLLLTPCSETEKLRQH